MSEEIMRQNLIVLCQTYATAKGLALTTVSKEIHGRHEFLEEYLKGTMAPTTKTYFRMLQKLRTRWPARTAWPKTLGIAPIARNPAKAPALRGPRTPRSLPGRDSRGKFLGKKVPKRASRS
jgi:hypothetical protein